MPAQCSFQAKISLIQIIDKQQLPRQFHGINELTSEKEGTAPYT
jgi:hypothetical protein